MKERLSKKEKDVFDTPRRGENSSLPVPKKHPDSLGALELRKFADEGVWSKSQHNDRRNESRAKPNFKTKVKRGRLL